MLIQSACLVALVLVLWRLVAHVANRPTIDDARPFECRCGRAYRSDHALAQHVGAMHPPEWDGAEVRLLPPVRGESGGAS